MTATMKDVAARAGVSVSTVSRVLGDQPGVGRVVRERVRQAMAEAGYTPNTLARSLRRQETMVWGLLISDIQNTFFTGLVRAVEDVAQRNGYSLTLCNSDEDVTKERRYIDVLVAEQISGLVITAEDEERTDLRPALDRGIPVVAIDRKVRSADVDTVLVDNRGGARAAVEHLVSQGAQRIAILLGTETFTPHAERLAGYQEALRRHGLPYDGALVLRAGSHNIGGANAIRNVFGQPDRPDALFISNNQLTVTAMPVLGALGLRAPQDLLIACFDDLPLAAAVGDGGLTVVDQPTYDLGRRAAELLVDRIRNPQRPVREHLLGTRLIVRGSSQPPLKP